MEIPCNKDVQKMTYGAISFWREFFQQHYSSVFDQLKSEKLRKSEKSEKLPSHFEMLHEKIWKSAFLISFVNQF